MGVVSEPVLVRFDVVDGDLSQGRAAGLPWAQRAVAMVVWCQVATSSIKAA